MTSARPARGPAPSLAVAEAAPRTPLGGLLPPLRPNTGHDSADATLAALETAGFSPVRLLSERDGYRFVEGLKTNG